MITRIRRIRQRGGNKNRCPLKMGRTENGDLAIDKENFESGNTEDSLMAMNFQLVTKEDFARIIPYFDNILNSDDLENKVLALTLLLHFRDIEQGKGLRNPLIEGLMHIYVKHSQFVLKVVPHIPKFGYYKDLCRLYTEADKMEYAELKQVLIDCFIQKLKVEHAKGKIVNCAKFAPREKKKYQKFAYDLSKQMFPDSKAHLRDYRVYLQECFKNYEQITEMLMCQGKWAEIDPKFVPSICFQRYKKAFLDPKKEKLNDDREKVKKKFTQHVKDAAEGKNGAKVNAKRLFVNELMEQMQSYFHQCEASLSEEKKILKLALEAQMKDILNDVAKNGKLFNENIAVMSDVSGSMSGTPMNVSLGLGLIIGELNTHPLFGKRVMTFDSTPRWIDISSKPTFCEKAKALSAVPGYSTNFDAAMRLLISTAKEEQDIPKVLFVLSDMQFNEASSQTPETAHERFVKLFKQHGFSEQSIPVIVYWNLRGTDNFVVDSSAKGIICIAGYSQNLLKSIMNAPDVEYLKNMNPFMFIKDLLNSKRYQVIRSIAEECLKEKKGNKESLNKENDMELEDDSESSG